MARSTRQVIETNPEGTLQSYTFKYNLRVCLSRFAPVKHGMRRSFYRAKRSAREALTWLSQTLLTRPKRNEF